MPELRVLQIATAAPYHPALARLSLLFPSLRTAAGGFAVALEQHTPEEILAQCIAEGVRVAGSVIRYRK